MRLFFVINSMQGGGAARVTAILCNELVNRGEDVFIATNLSTHKVDYLLDKSINVYSIYSQNHLADNKIKRFFYHVRELRRLLNVVRPDIIIGEQEDATLYSIVARFFMGIPLIAHRHNTFKILGLSSVQRLIFNNADITVLLHHTDFEFVGDRIRKKMVIYNPCSFKINSEALNKEKNVIVVGSIDRWFNKGFDLILEIWKIVTNTISDWKLIIVGSGNIESTDYLKKLVVDYGVKNSVQFTGYVHNVDEYLAKSSIFALPSRVEGFPMVLNEAVSQNCACISFELGGVIPEIYSDKAVLCVKDSDTIEFSEKLVELMSNVNLRRNLCEYSRREIKQYSIERIASEWQDLFVKMKIDKRG